MFSCDIENELKKKKKTFFLFDWYGKSLIFVINPRNYMRIKLKKKKKIHLPKLNPK